MHNHYISNFNSLRPINTNVNISNTTSLSSIGTGQMVIGDFTTSTGSNNDCIGLSNIARNLGVAIGKETICGVGGVSVGYRSHNQTDVIHIGRDNFQMQLVQIYSVLIGRILLRIHYYLGMDRIQTYVQIVHFKLYIQTHQ